MTNTHYKIRVLTWLTTTALLFSLLPALNIHHKTVSVKEFESFEDFFQADVLERYRNAFLYELGFSGDKEKVIVGKDGWLYLGDEYENGMGRGRGIKNITPERLTEWIDSMKSRQKWLASQGIELLFVIAPNKHSIYPEHLPNGVTLADPNNTDRLVEAMSNAGIRNFDARETLLNAKQSHAFLYPKTDTHWTSLAAYLTYSGLMAEVKHARPGLGNAVNIPTEAFKLINNKPRDLAGLLKLSQYLGPISGKSYSYPNHEGTDHELCLEIFTSYSIPRTDCDSVQNKALAVFHTKYVVSNPDAINDGTVLIVRDSFGNAMSTLLNSSFTRSVQVHHRHTMNEVNFKKIIQMEPPEIVIYIIAERSLFNEHSFFSFK